MAFLLLSACAGLNCKAQTTTAVVRAFREDPPKVDDSIVPYVIDGGSRFSRAVILLV
jgi:hypothetical protein